MFGYEKNRFYCSWTPPFIAFGTQGLTKQLPATFVSTVLEHSKQWRALQKHRKRILNSSPSPSPSPASAPCPLFYNVNSGDSTVHIEEQWRHGLLLLLFLHHVSTVLQRDPSPFAPCLHCSAT